MIDDDNAMLVGFHPSLSVFNSSIVVQASVGWNCLLFCEEKAELSGEYSRNLGVDETRDRNCIGRRSC